MAALLANSRTTKQIASYLGIDEGRVRKIIRVLAAKIDADLAGDVRVTIALWWTAHAA